MVIEIVIKHSDKPDKKYMAIIDNKKLFILVLKIIQIIQCITMMKENKDIYRDINMIIIQILCMHRFTQLIYYGINHQ